MSEQVQELNDRTFLAAVTSGVVLVDFWAPWCGPCRMQGPILESVSQRLGDAVKICKVNVDEAPATADRFGIRAIPTLALLKDGKVVEVMTGVQQAAVLIKAIEDANR